jgi:hypothetical protein
VLGGALGTTRKLTGHLYDAVSSCQAFAFLPCYMESDRIEELIAYREQLLSIEDKVSNDMELAKLRRRDIPLQLG